jgi:prefoldin subunit 5
MQAEVERLTAQVKALTSQLEGAQTRITELEATEGKLKRALSAFSS